MLLIEYPSTDPRFNLALEEYIFESVDKSRSYLYLWQNDNTVVVGKNQNTIEEIDMGYVDAHGIKVVRRLSGGGAVYHDLGNVNFSIIADANQANKLDFEAFCKPVVMALRELGVPAEINGRNDITIDGRKFSGNSQYLRRDRVMHHGTIMFDSNLDILSKALRAPADKIESKSLKSVRSRVTNVKEHMNREITLEEFTDTLKQKLLGPLYQRLELSDEDIKEVEKIRQARYAAWEWNFGYSPKYSITKRRRFDGCGSIEVRMEVDRGGKVSEMRFFGDYFGLRDSTELAAMFIGQRANREDYEKIVAGIDVGDYFKNLSAKDFLHMLEQA